MSPDFQNEKVAAVAIIAAIQELRGCQVREFAIQDAMALYDAVRAKVPIIISSPAAEIAP